MFSREFLLCVVLALHRSTDQSSHSIIKMEPGLLRTVFIILLYVLRSYSMKAI